MNDLISRSALLKEVTRGFDAFVHGAYFRAACDAIRAKRAVICMLNDDPAVDAVEVVRCRDCEEYIPWLEGRICGRIGSYFGNTKPDDFCSRGIRKMDAEVEGC